MSKIPLQSYYKIENKYEVGIDEAGRGPLFGRLYVAAVVLPKTNDYAHENMKDSKKFHSKRKIREVADYIKNHALAWSVSYVEPETIDKINIRQSVFQGMHECITQIRNQLLLESETTLLLIDGNDFKPYTIYNETQEEIRTFSHETIEGGDNKYTAIAAASILAKVSRDDYIHELCEQYPDLDARYQLNKNMGYATRAHLNGIAEYGITQWHRKTFGHHCKHAKMNEIRET